MFNVKRGKELFLDDVTGSIVMSHPYVLEVPSLRFRSVIGARRNVIRDDVVVGVLLKYLHIIKGIGAWEKILDEPCA